MSEWLEFKDKLPNHNQRIKVKSNDLWNGECIFQDGKFVYFSIKGGCFGNPTHWMPLNE